MSYSIWRPINGPVKDWPLAVADAKTVLPSDLIEVDRIRASYHGPMYFLLRQDGVANRQCSPASCIMTRSSSDQ